MRRIIYLFLLFIISGSKLIAQCTIVPVGPADSNMADFNASGRGTLAMDKHGNPFVLYNEYYQLSTYNAVVRKFTNNKWSPVGSPDFINDQTLNDMTIDKYGTPYVVVEDGSVGNKATVMKYNGTSWVLVGTKGFTAGTALRPKIAVDTIGTPYVIYTDVLNSSKANVMKFNGTSWVNVGNADFSSSSITYSSITFSSTDTLYVAFSLNNGSGGGISVMKFNGTSWKSAAPI
ncbi:MAG TPA: hypothetical protein VN922_03755, partial [Bacteroidia bacterium]|nr:hypothetical protein [Bacteroidia bacterium]